MKLRDWMVCGALLVAASAQAFQLSPMGTAAERKFAKRWGVTMRVQIWTMETALHNFADPVHEALTQKTYGCDDDWSYCADPDLENAGPYVIAGVRWNDDPPFKLDPRQAKGTPCSTDTISFVTQTRCWVTLFNAAEKTAKAEPGHFLDPTNGNYMLRSHFGDLQFLHAMASKDDEPAEQTKAKVMMWAEFAWGVVNGTYGLGTKLRDIQIAGWSEHFTNGHTVQELFTLGRPWLRLHIEEVAFGSLLHMVQDSFAAGHVDRAEPISGSTCDTNVATAGVIREFHSYGLQDHHKHKEADSPDAARAHLQMADPDAVVVGQRLRDFKRARAPWSEVQRYLAQCVFALDDGVRGASPGAAFQP